MVRRGQALWLEHLGRAVTALLAALLQGFSIARFSEVLDRAGYAQSPLTTSLRYRSTLFFLIDWFRHPLDQPDSAARLGIYAVRSMHSFVRRRSRDLFDKARGEGVPLSQYDLAEVLLAFSGVCLSIMECELHMGPLPPADKAAMVHMWRLVGYHLGVHDAFNVCESVERVEACFDDLMVWNPERLLTCRESTHTLQAAASRGFGKHLGVGEAYWVAFLVALERGRLGLGDGAGGQPGYVRARPLAGLVEIVLRDFKRIGTSDAANAAARHTLLAMREGARRQPQLTHAIMAHVLPWAGLFHDQIVWRTHAVLATVRSMATRQYWQRVE